MLNSELSLAASEPKPSPPKALGKDGRPNFPSLSMVPGNTYSGTRVPARDKWGASRVELHPVLLSYFASRGVVLGTRSSAMKAFLFRWGAQGKVLEASGCWLVFGIKRSTALTRSWMLVIYMARARRPELFAAFFNFEGYFEADCEAARTLGDATAQNQKMQR